MAKLSRELNGQLGMTWGLFSVAGLVAFLALSAAHAQLGTTFLSFEGVGVITDNPPSATCQTAGYSFGDTYWTVYRFSLSPSTTPDALTFIKRNNIYRITSTQSPGFSLNGASTTSWDSITGHASRATLSPSSSTLTILSGINGSITSGTGNIKMTGTIDDFETNTGCTIHWHAALVARPT
jgi:hypothetical protein